MLPEGEVFLAKPFTPETLLETVRSTLDRASAASEP
jgi:DNA-binding response OmpR family regulator